MQGNCFPARFGLAQDFTFLLLTFESEGGATSPPKVLPIILKKWSFNGETPPLKLPPHPFIHIMHNQNSYLPKALRFTPIKSRLSRQKTKAPYQFHGIKLGPLLLLL
jgi:hypothetical protein